MRISNNLDRAKKIEAVAAEKMPCNILLDLFFIVIYFLRGKICFMNSETCA